MSKDSSKNKKRSLCSAHGGPGPQDERANFHRRVITKLNRRELEDVYYKTREDNVQLKRRINDLSVDHKILKTKIIRFAEQQKRSGSADIINEKFERVLEEQSQHIHVLEETNGELNDKLLSLKKQMNCLKRFIRKNRSKLLKNGAEHRKSLEVAEQNDEHKHEEISSRCEHHHHCNGNNLPVESSKHVHVKHCQCCKESTNGHAKNEQNNLIVVNDENIDKNSHNEFISRASKANQKSLDLFENATQTEEDEKRNDYVKINEILTRKVAEEQVKVIELQRSLNNLKITNEVLSQLQELKEEMKPKNNIEDNYSDNTKEKELEVMLNHSKEKIKNLEDENLNLTSEILKIQSEFKEFRLNNEKITKEMNNASVDNFDYNLNVIKLTKVLNENNFNDNGKKPNTANQVEIKKINNPNQLDETVPKECNKDLEEKQNHNGGVRTNPHTDLTNEIILSKDVSNEILYATSKENLSETNIENDPTSCKVDNYSYKELKNNDNEIEKDNNQNNKNDNSFDEATYDIERNISETSTPSLDSSDDSLSEGEIPNDDISSLHYDLKSENINNNISCETDSLKSSVSERAKDFLNLLTKEMVRCESLDMKIRQNGYYLNGSAKQDKNLFEFEEANDFENVASFTLHINAIKIDLKEILDELSGYFFALKWDFDGQQMTSKLLNERNFAHLNYSSCNRIEMNPEAMDYFNNSNIHIEILKVIDDDSLPFANCSFMLKRVFTELNKKVIFSLPLRRGNAEDISECGFLTGWCQLEYKTESGCDF